MEFISKQSLGSYGVIFVHDDEGIGSYGVVSVHDDEGNGADFVQSFRVWRILDGQVTEHADPFFSPFSSTNAFEV